MGVQFGDSCDHYDLQSDIGLKWTENILNSVTNAPAPAGRGTRALLLKNGVFKTCTYQTTWFAGWALYINSQIGGGVIYALSAANSASATMATVRTENDGSLSIYAGNTLNLIANSMAATLAPDTWNYLEVGVVLSGTAPIQATVTLRLNGTVLLSGVASTGVNASGTLLGTNQANVHSFFYNSVASAYARDFYIADGSGSGSVNGFIGDIAISALFPRADVLAQWTAVGGVGGELWDHCNPQFPETNDDTIYIASQTNGQIANFDWEPITPFTGTIPFIHYGVYNRKDAEGSRAFRQTTHAVANGPTIAPGDSFRYDFFAMDQDPNTSLPWTQANFNASEFGLVVTS
jgi:hypothetical protein